MRTVISLGDVLSWSTRMTVKVGLSELYQRFIEWLGARRVVPGIPSLVEFKREIETTWKESADIHNQWSGIRIRS